MKMTRMTETVFAELSDQWAKNADRMPDTDRPVENLVYLLTQDPSQWYVVGDTDTVFFLRGVIPSLSAGFYALNIEDVPTVDAKNEIRDIMREWDLRRLTYLVPCPLVQIVRAATRIGFWPEGRLKDAAIYNGEYTDMDVLGFHRAEVESGKISVSGPAAVDTGKPKRRRRRSRRKKKASGGESQKET